VWIYRLEADRCALLFNVLGQEIRKLGGRDDALKSLLLELFKCAIVPYLKTITLLLRSGNIPILHRSQFMIKLYGKWPLPGVPAINPIF